MLGKTGENPQTLTLPNANAPDTPFWGTSWEYTGLVRYNNFDSIVTMFTEVIAHQNDKFFPREV